MKQCNGYKKCTRCECIYPIMMFHKDKTKPDGLQSCCKDCGKEYFINHKEHIKNYKREYNRKYVQTRKGKEVKRKTSKNYNQTEKGKKVKKRADKKYKHSENGKRTITKYWQSPVGKLARSRGRHKHNKKGFILLMNNPFPDEIDIDYHHISPNLPFVIPLPRLTHQYVPGASGNKHFIHNQNWIELLYSLDLEKIISIEEFNNSS